MNGIQFPTNLEQEMNKFGVAPIIYRPSECNYVTVCLLVKGKKVIARGLAIRSPKDANDKHRGVNSATGRAIKAMYHKFNRDMEFDDYRNDLRLPINDDYDRPGHLVLVPEYFEFKSEYKPVLSVEEEKIVENYIRINGKKTTEQKE